MEEINLRQRLVLSVQVMFMDIKQVKFRLEKFEMPFTGDAPVFCLHIVCIVQRHFSLGMNNCARANRVCFSFSSVWKVLPFFSHFLPVLLPVLMLEEAPRSYCHTSL